MMGESEEELQEVAGDLKLDPNQIQQTLSQNSFMAVVHEKWLDSVTKKGTLPSKEHGIPSLGNNSRSTLFAKSSRPWKKIAVSKFTRCTEGEFCIPQIKLDRVMSAQSDFMEFMGTVAKQVYQAEWEAAYQKCSCTLSRYHRSLCAQREKTSVIELVQSLYNCPIIYLNQEVVSDTSKASAKFAGTQVSGGLDCSTQHPNLLSAYCAIVTEENVYLLQPYHEHTVHDVTMFSPAMLANSYGKLHFVIYQMLQAVAHCHSRGVTCGNITLADFVIDEKLWVQFCGPKLNDIQQFCQSRKLKRNDDHSNMTSTQSRAIARGSQEEAGISHRERQSSAIDGRQSQSETNLKMDSLPEIMQKWTMGQISNYDYLMTLNRLANRQMGNPNHHPIMPWVMDFSRPDGGYRDFSKSKYRLNKGDKQLDFTYESALQMQALTEEDGGSSGPSLLAAAQVPHHISDVLSEITYYIYKARCTPKSLLQAHVRTVWVPNEYPASVQRLQAWTPDECIPEFFSDASIFRSIHEDLPDLEVPSWCSGPEDFVERHMALLESTHVSERLHRWIDLTFGCKLSGVAAVKAKNVVLCVVDQHTLPANNGVVQLFNIPHPKRFAPSPYMSLDPPLINRPKMRNEAEVSITMATGQEEYGAKTELDGMVGEEGGVTSKPPAVLEKSDGNSLTRESLMSSVESEKGPEQSESALLEAQTAARNRSQSFNTEGMNTAQSFPGDDSQLSKNPIRKLPFFRPKSDMPVDSRLVRPELATIVLPEDYDPLSALNQLESLYSFTSKASYHLPIKHKVEDREAKWQQLVARDVVALGCLIAELCLAPKLRYQQIGCDLDTRWQHLKNVAGVDYQELPRPVREIVHILLRKVRSGESEAMVAPWDLASCFQGSPHGHPPLSPGLLLQPHSELIPFPRYFPSLYGFLGELHRQKFQATSDSSQPPDLTDHQAMNMVQLARHWLPRVTQDINIEGRDLLLPYIRNLFQDNSTAVYAALSLFSKYSAHLGPKLAEAELIPLLAHLFDSEFSSPDYLLLFQHSFLSQVIMSLGLKPFLDTLVGYVTEATSGLKHCPMFVEGASEQVSGLTAMSSTVSNSIRETETFLSGPEGMSVDEGLFGSDDGEGDEVVDEASEERMMDQEEGNSVEESPLEGGSQQEEEDVANEDAVVDPDFPVEDAASLDEQMFPTSEGSETGSRGDGEPDTASISSGNLPSLSEQAEDNPPHLDFSIKSTLTSQSTTPSPPASTSSQSLTKDQDPFASEKKPSSDQFTRTYKKQLSSKLYQVSTLIGKSLSDVASESIMWLVHRIGPALTVCFITPKLLDALSACYMQPQQLIYCYAHDDQNADEIDTFSACIGKKTVAGDVNAKHILKCLTDIAVLYGDQFIFQQYLPFIKETVRRVQRKVSAKLEGRLISSVVLLRHILPYLTDSSLMEKLQYFFAKLVHPILDIMSCTSITFPSGSQVRAVVCYKLVDILNTIALRIGREMTRDHMTDILKRFFLCFKLASSNCESIASFHPEARRQNSLALSTDSEDKYLVIEVDNETNQLSFGSPVGPQFRARSTDSTSDLSPVALFGSNSSPTIRPSHLGPGSQSEDSSSLDDIRGLLQEVFTPELAHAAYIPLCRLTGSIHMERILDNHEQIWALSSKHEKAMSTQLTPQIQSPLSDDGSLLSSPAGSFQVEDRSWSSMSTELAPGGSVGGRGTFGGKMTIIGNRIAPSFGGGGDEEEEDVMPAASQKSMSEGEGSRDIRAEEVILPEAHISPRLEMNKSKRTLRGTWLSYWEQYLGRDDHDSSFHFCQIKLQTFTGHSNGIKALCMMPNENSFLSASKDKTVKIWSLRNSGDGSSKSSCQLTYHHHRKTVFDVRLLESQRLVASCDGNVHVWDPINGAAVRGYDLSRSQPSCMEVLPAPSPCLAVSSGDASIRFIDTRHGGVQQEIRVASGPLGLIRCMAVSTDGHTLGVGFSSGVLSMVDLRTGLLMGGWRAHEGEILQIKPHINRTFITSSVDHTMALWKDDSTKVCQFRGATEPVHCVCLSDNQVLSATFGNRIGIHTAISAQASYSSWKLRSDSFKGAISALSVMPLNKLLLVASDNGSIFLLA